MLFLCFTGYKLIYGNTRSQNSPLIPIDLEFKCTFKILRDIGENLNPLNVVDNRAIVQPQVVPQPHVTLLNFAKSSLKNSSNAMVKPITIENFGLKEDTMRLVHNTCQYKG